MKDPTGTTTSLWYSLSRHVDKHAAPFRRMMKRGSGVYRVCFRPYHIAMPCVSRFYGIAIYLYYKDHAPPHFHAIYGEEEVMIEIATGNVLAGKIPKRAAKLVQEWLSQHQAELEVDWDLAISGLPLNPVPPLE